MSNKGVASPGSIKKIKPNSGTRSIAKADDNYSTLLGPENLVKRASCYRESSDGSVKQRPPAKVSFAVIDEIVGEEPAKLFSSAPKGMIAKQSNPFGVSEKDLIPSAVENADNMRKAVHASEEEFLEEQRIRKARDDSEMSYLAEVLIGSHAGKCEKEYIHSLVSKTSDANSSGQECFKPIVKDERFISDEELETLAIKDELTKQPDSEELDLIRAIELSKADTSKEDEDLQEALEASMKSLDQKDRDDNMKVSGSSSSSSSSSI